MHGVIDGTPRVSVRMVLHVPVIDEFLPLSQILALTAIRVFALWPLSLVMLKLSVEVVVHLSLLVMELLDHAVVV